MALIDDLGAGPVCLDTALVIYLIEENQLFSAVIAPLFEAADAGELELVVSALTLLEVLVVPYRAGNIALAERYEAVLTRSRGMRMIDLTREHMRLAAQLRAASMLRPLTHSNSQLALQADVQPSSPMTGGCPQYPG